jgi:hypothetical protein
MNNMDLNEADVLEEKILLSPKNLMKAESDLKE